MKFVSVFYIIICSFLLGQCQSQKAPVAKESKILKLRDVPYNIHDHDHHFTVANELIEVSGLAFNIDQGTLMAVNDELGYIYELDKEEGTILSKKKFADFGDYEGIEFMANDLIVVRSNGKIYLYNQESDNTYKIIRTNVSTSNNIEGVSYDPTQNQILIACKGTPRVPGLIEETKGKLICTYDIASENLLAEPYILIKDKALKKAVEEIYNDIGQTEAQLENLKDRVEGFAPSGLAIHPITGHLYILSAKSKLLVVIDKQKEIKHVHFLDQNLHVQPEGICFTSEGDMYISNEGKTKPATIFLYTYQK